METKRELDLSFNFFFFKKSLLLTVDVNTVCVEGLN